MSTSLAGTVGAYAAALGLLSLATALIRRGLGRLHAGGAVVLGCGAALNALIAGVGIAVGGRPAEPAPFTGYVAVSVLAVPLGWRYARGSARGWDALTFALAALTLSVICVRLQRTWG